MLFATVKSAATELCKREEDEEEHTRNLRTVFLWLGPPRAERRSAV